MPETEDSRWKKIWFEWLKPLLVVLLITGAFRSAVADWNDVPTGSMKPTIMEGDRIFINKLAYDLKVPFTSIRLAIWDDPQRGDIIVLFSPHDGKRLVKRTVGVPGDLIEMRNSLLFVNGKKASYGKLDPASFAAIPHEQVAEFRFYKEDVAGRDHAVMLTPWKEAVRNFGPIVVPAKSYFVMGDNRDDSFDSRMFGFVNRTQIVGRATSVVASLDPKDRYFPRWSRFFSSLR